MVKKRIGKATAILITATMLAAMLPAAAFAEKAGEGVTDSMSIEASSDQASAAEPAQDPQSNEAKSASITKTKAEELARKYVNIPEEYTLQGANLSADRLIKGTRNVWGLSFVKRVNGQHMGNIYVGIHADNGQLMSYNYYNAADTKPSYPLKVERDGAESVAASFISEVAGDYAGKVKLNEGYGAELLPALTGEVRHHFRYDRYVNDLPFLDNYIDVVVDSEGFVVEYSFVWDDTITFPSVSNYLSLDKAMEKLREVGTPELKYMITTGENGKRIPVLTYELAPYTIDAVTGNKSSEDIYRNYRYSGEVSETPVTDKPLSSKPQLAAIKEEQAIKIVASAFKLPEGAELSHSSYNEYSNDDTGQLESSWDFSWTIKKDGKEVGSIWAMVNGQTGDVQNYNFYWRNDTASENKESISLEDASKTAVETVKKQLPWLAHELYLIKPDPKQYEKISATDLTNYYIRFTHKVHGASVEYDYINVTVDAKTGEVTGFESYIQPFTYPDQAPVTIAPSEALDRWMDYYQAELTYRVANEYSQDGQPILIEKYNLLIASGELSPDDNIGITSTVGLVYRLKAKPLDQQVFLDAVSGQWRNAETGETTQLERPKVLDIDGHWAQRQLELMVAYKALDVIDGKVRPNEVIKRGELIKMLVIARSGGNYRYSMTSNDTASMKLGSFNDVGASSEYFAYVEDALQQNLIDVGDGSFNPEGTVTREEMAELIVRALGYNTLAKHGDIFADNFKDSDQLNNKGQAAIVVGLDIMSTTADGKFQPNKKVQRAEAATAFFRYLQSRAELQEAPLRY